LPDMLDIMSAPWPPFASTGPSASMAGTPSSVPQPGAPVRQHWDSSAVACDSLPLERFRKDSQRDRQQTVPLTNDSLPAYRMSSMSSAQDSQMDRQQTVPLTNDSLPAHRMSSMSSAKVSPTTLDSLPVNRAGRDKGSATCESISRMGSKDPFTAFTRPCDNIDGIATGSRWGCGAKPCDDLPEPPASGTLLASKDSSPVPYIPTVDNFDCAGLSRGQLGMKTCDELPVPYTPTQDNLDMLGFSRGCNGANRDHYVPTFDNFDQSGFPASVADANPRTAEIFPEIMQCMGPPGSLFPPTHGAGTRQASEQTFCWRA